uniref:Uncharacterized protein n=1 Tax=Octopus bimaculoides TaxID=37653 RepID=A0A0L8GA02_OCTBM
MLALIIQFIVLSQFNKLKNGPSSMCSFSMLERAGIAWVSKVIFPVIKLQLNHQNI